MENPFPRQHSKGKLTLEQESDEAGISTETCGRGTLGRHVSPTVEAKGRTVGVLQGVSPPESPDRMKNSILRGTIECQAHPAAPDLNTWGVSGNVQ